jgi:hypothetical protein
MPCIFLCVVVRCGCDSKRDTIAELFLFSRADDTSGDN